MYETSQPYEYNTCIYIYIYMYIYNGSKTMMISTKGFYVMLKYNCDNNPRKLGYAPPRSKDTYAMYT